MTPTIGRIVHYKLNAINAEHVNRRREDGKGERSASQDKSGAQVHVGNIVHEGETVPMMITRTFIGTASLVNGQVILDGNDGLWVTSVEQGQEPGNWDWPYIAPTPEDPPTVA